MVSKAFVVDAYQRKCELMAELAPDLDLTLITPAFWRSRNARFEPVHIAGYKIIVAQLGLNGNFHLHWYRGLAANMRRIRPDLAHIDEEPYNFATWLAYRAARGVGARALFFTWQNLLRRYPPPFGWFEQDVLSRSSIALAGNSDAEAGLRSKGFGGIVRVVPQFGVDETLFRPPAVLTKPGFVVGYAGRLDSEKGIDVLLRACAGLVDAEIRIAGIGPEQEALFKLAVELGMHERVHFVGRLDTSSLIRFYQDLNVLVLPSRSRPNWVEQFGRVLIEAMACATPVIGSNCGEIPNVIGDAGRLVPEGDAEALSIELRRLRDAPDAATSLGERGRERAIGRFSMRQVAVATLAAYREALA